MKKIPKRLRGERGKLKGGRVPDCVTRVAVGRGVACELLPRGLYQSAAATITKTYRTDGLNNREGRGSSLLPLTLLIRTPIPTNPSN